ncbi:MAG: hypothetical protein AB7H43_06025 [Acidimicrobiia bacterium]
MVVEVETSTARDRTGAVAVACGVAGAVLAFVLYWLVVPGVVLGLAAVGLGWKARRGGRLELGSVAMTLGVVAVLLVPAFLATADAAEDWGRDCVTDPEPDPNC